MIATILKGLFIGLTVSAPMGPVGMLCIQRTISKGRRHGLATGLGATLSDALYAGITILAMGIVSEFVETNLFLLQIIGSIVLGLFGYYLLNCNPVKNISNKKEQKQSFTEDFITGFLLTFSNVLIVLLFISLYARFHFVRPPFDWWSFGVGITSIIVGAILWWFFITTIVSKLRRWFNIRGIWMMNKILGSIIMILSVIGFLSIFIKK